MAVVRELLTRLGFQVNDSQLRRYEGSVNRIKDNANSAAESFRGMLVAFAGVGALQGLAKFADQLQSTEARIAQLPQTLGDSAAAFESVAKHASDARQSIDAYATFYLRVGNSAKNIIKTQEDLLSITDTVSKALVVGGATAAEQSSALLQFAQALGSGVLQGDEFRALAEAAPQLLDKIGEALKIPRENLKKAASEGKITTKLIVEALKEIGPTFDEQFKNMPLTIGQATTIVANRWGVFIQRLNRESQAVTKIANLFLSAFDKIESGLDSLNDFFGGATNTLKFFAIAITAAVLPSLVRLGVGFLAFLASPAGLLIAGLTLIGLALEDVYQWMTGGQSVAEDFFGSFDQYRDDVFALKDSIVEFATISMKFLSELYKSFSENLDIRQIGEGTLQVLRGIGEQIMGLINIVSGLGKVLAGVFSFSGSAIAEGINLQGQGVRQLAAGVGNQLQGIGNVAGGFTGGPQSQPIFNAASLAKTPVSSLRIENNITVPPGTPQQQVDFLNRSAKESAQKNYGDLARYFGQVGQ